MKYKVPTLKYTVGDVVEFTSGGFGMITAVDLEELLTSDEGQDLPLTSVIDTSNVGYCCTEVEGHAYHESDKYAWFTQDEFLRVVQEVTR